MTVASSPQPEDVSDMSLDVELKGCGATPCCDPRRTPHRFFVLIFMCFLSFGKFIFKFWYADFLEDT